MKTPLIRLLLLAALVPQAGLRAQSNYGTPYVFTTLAGDATGGASLGTVPTDWKLSGTGDFNGDGKADIVLSNTVTGDRAMWLMNSTTISSNLYLGNVPVEWTINAVGDFNGDGKADIFWGNTVTGDRSMWLMNGGTLTEGDYLGSVPVEWANPP